MSSQKRSFIVPLGHSDIKTVLLTLPQLDDKLPSLEETSIRRLASNYPDERDGKHLDRAFELKRMAKSLILNFLELIGIMGITPEEVGPLLHDAHPSKARQD